MCFVYDGSSPLVQIGAHDNLKLVKVSFRKAGASQCFPSLASAA